MDRGDWAHRIELHFRAPNYDARIEHSVGGCEQPLHVLMERIVIARGNRLCE